MVSLFLGDESSRQLAAAFIYCGNDSKAGSFSGIISLANDVITSSVDHWALWVWNWAEDEFNWRLRETFKGRSILVSYSGLFFTRINGIIDADTTQSYTRCNTTVYCFSSVIAVFSFVFQISLRTMRHCQLRKSPHVTADEQFSITFNVCGFIPLMVLTVDKEYFRLPLLDTRTQS